MLEATAELVDDHGRQHRLNAIGADEERLARLDDGDRLTGTGTVAEDGRRYLLVHALDAVEALGRPCPVITRAAQRLAR